MIPEEIQKKIDNLRKVYINQDDQQAIDQIEANLRKRIIEAKLSSNDTVKAILEDAQKRVDEINFLLAYDEGLTEVDRKGLFRERRAHRFYLQRFGKDINEYVKSVENFVDGKLNP